MVIGRTALLQSAHGLCVIYAMKASMGSAVPALTPRSKGKSDAACLRQPMHTSIAALETQLCTCDVHQAFLATGMALTCGLGCVFACGTRCKARGAALGIGVCTIGCGTMQCLMVPLSTFGPLSFSM